VTNVVKLIGIVAIAVAFASVQVPARGLDGEPRPLLEGLDFPTSLAFLPDGTLLFTEKETGNVRVVTPSGELLARPFVTLPVIPDSERGLLGIEVHPRFEREPWVYLYHSDPADGLNRLVRVRADGRVSSGPPEPLLDGISAVSGYHNGGSLEFGVDGMLFVALGEAHEADRAQDPGDVGGKVVRLTDEGRPPGDGPFGEGNPVWSIGHRNSFGLCVDPSSGALWETENGPTGDDEVNRIEPGGNYGWPVVTGVADDGRFVDPVEVFEESIVPTGCEVVGGTLWFGSFDGRLWRLDDPTRPSSRAEPVSSFPTGVTDVALGPDGDLYITTADAIWTLGGLRAESPSPTTTGVTTSAATGSPPTSSADDGSTGWRGAVAIAAIVVLAGALAARLIAGRRLRRDGGGPRPGG
jgi:glucose/arabinose dehydrogenase